MSGRYLLAASLLCTPMIPQAMPASINLSDLDGSNGFVINGIDASDLAGHSVSSAGDINGDGVDDLIIGAYNSEPNGSSAGGESYVVFGGGGIGNAGSINLSALDGSNGFVINGIDATDNSGRSVSNAGDINGDSVDDLIIGADGAEPNGNSTAGESYVIFGGSGIGNAGSINLSGIDGSNGFVINGVDANDRSGRSVSSAGDINDDGVDDLIIGAFSADPNSNSSAGESYLVFGGSGLGSFGSINLSGIDGSNGFIINGINANDFSGRSVSSAGDINGDGVDDLIIGAYGGDPNGNSAAGESYVVFGGSGVGGGGSINLSLLTGGSGFVINGIDADDHSGRSVSSAGDFNGDSVDDLIIGADGADPNGNNDAGESYVVFGGSAVGSAGSIDLSSLTGSNGFVINGIDASDRSGFSVSGAGDINGDGVDDLIIGAPYADPNGNSTAGKSYVVFGVANPPVEVDLVSSCLAGLGRVDLNIVNTQTPSSVYRYELQGQSARQTTVVFEDWGRMPITGRPPGTYSAVVERDGVTILSESIPINCTAATPPVSTPEVTILNACRTSNGYVLFQMVNPTASSRPYVIEFEGVPNRSTTAAAFGQAVRATTGRPDGTYNYLVRTGSTTVDSGQVTVDCD